MQYFVTLDGQEFPLTMGRTDGSGHAQVGGSEAEILSPAKHGRAALISVDGHVFRVLASPPGTGRGPRQFTINGRSVRVSIENETERRARPIRDKSVARRATVVAPMPGRVVKVSVAVGDLVSVGTPLLGIEAMKMENELLSNASGRITKLGVQPGDAVEADQELLVIEPA
jgi:biotin carboxyl carrier protein